MDDLSHILHVWENLEERHREGTRDQLPKDVRLAVLLSNSPTEHEKGLIAQQHLFPDYAQMLVHSATVIYSHTRGPAPLI